ncbi:anthrone oxygenase family protein [Rhodococcus sp. (in: high G+C Gram-positive bacteria)]|uniref:anthrone oxygenase family protein n=1 Tax=Rhodococcus sp. TaxID=1831 RepID=UPI003890F53C
MDWLSIVAVVVVGPMVGVEASVAFVINPIVDRLPGNAGLLARSDGGRMLGRAMPFWYVGSLVLTVATALLSPAAWAAWASAALLALSIGLSVAVLVPINNRSKNWTPETAPSDWREQVGRWDRYHLVRIALLVAAFALLAVAAAA